jgi:hypothetical protein
MLPIIISLIGALPSLATAYKTVKDVNKEPSKLINQNLAKDGKAALSTKELQSILPKDLNLLKRQTAISILESTKVWHWLEKRGCDADDLGTMVDFACVVYKVIRRKK